ncbi:putative histidine kinase-like protein M3YPp [Cucurbitaria berberidis CBS 394.84]|uniref:histidine kinase n=1 Tax=Cucurbitaria berberidis CBS 394.84 TaxID=1168544 RepID=A0A9P4GTV3_9PLEO|nr:putative histidine kinase-like protein M3YPp [Cucurbitaria berberidis CBS 394.84]KAF1851401.1 putative histidine kinase-like protein M3YPp [Cucurbitaria berberidis CBS 394.84]
MPTPPPDDGPGTTLNAADWTATLPQTDHVRFFRSRDWSRTALGPLETWSPTLRLFTSFVFADSRPACLWWGPTSNLVAIYNEHYVTLACAAHPKLMGSTFKEGYPDLVSGIQPYFEQARDTGVGVNYSSAASLIVERKGWREEAFFSGSFVPVGVPAEGYLNTVYEVTVQKLADRRTSMLNTLASVPSQSVESVYAHILATLETNASDVPLAILYKLEETAGSNLLQLQGHIGLPRGHDLIVASATMDSDQGLIPDMRRAGSATLILDCDERFDSVSWRGWGQRSKKIAIVPIMSASRLFGYLVFGTNPFRPFDGTCQQFVRDLSRMVSSIVSSAVESETNKKRQEQLEADLAFSDLKLRHLIDHASVGMCHVAMDGKMLWANDHFYKLAGKPPSEHSGRLAFLDVYHDEDRRKAEELWEDLLKGVDRIGVELRLKRMYTPPVGDPEPAQLQVLAFPYRDEAGRVRSIMACTTDISRLKWAQTFQARLAAEAREAKRQQEAFIDVVSHEMRNPLSAIVHCADAISNAVEECRAKLLQTPQPCLDILEENMQSAKIILQCANHQKRIIDDILTLSKLDSMLLSITPVAVQPAQLIDSIVSIFEAELKHDRIAHNIKSDTSLSDLGIDYVYLDPSRVTQVFINLLTNAIKFVKTSKQPTISIRFGACLSEPRAFFSNKMFWASERNQDVDVTSSPEWGPGEEIYLMFSVSDTGIGLQTTEIHRIFERFRQANVKTHVKYGGSGLGLFISKELTEKQGGEIGVSSILGHGSTFGFYVKARREEKPGPQAQSGLLDPNTHTDSSPQQLHVLLVEDNIINQQVLSKQLKKAQCHVNVANHGLEALNVLEEQTFDMVLMDLEMPVLDGLDAMRQIRKKEMAGEGLLGRAIGSRPNMSARLPIIAVTANVRKEQIDTAITAGADRVMQKPFKAADLVHMMKSLLPQKAPSTIDPPTPGVGEKSDGLIP